MAGSRAMWTALAGAAVLAGAAGAQEGPGSRAPSAADRAGIQQAYLKAAHTDAGDRFASAVAISGDTVVVGTRFEDGPATGVDGDPLGDTAPNAGAAWIFVRDGEAWSQQAYLKASNTAAGDSFGHAVAISGDTVVVGADLEDSAATGVGGDQGDNGASASGAAYVFVRQGGSWSQQAYLKASNTGAGHRFGFAVAVDGDTVVVGAFQEDGAATGVDGDPADGSASNAGAAYVFVRDGGSWSQQAYLKASNTGQFDEFGRSVSISGDTVAVGAWLEDGSSTGVGGAQRDDGAPNSGAVYVFTRSGTTWSQQAYVKASNTDAGDGFGQAVSLSDDTLVVGAREEDSGAEGVGGDQDDDAAANAGAAYVFARDGAGWSQQAYLKASNTDAGDLFGTSVSARGDELVVGAVSESSAATGVDGEQADDTAADAGAAYLFERDGTTWSQVGYLKALNTGAGDQFGASVGVAHGTVVVGAPLEDSAAEGVGGDPFDEGAPDSGAAHVFDVGDPWDDLGFALAGTHGEPLLVGLGTLEGGDPVSVVLTGALEDAPAFVILGLSVLGYAPFYGGTLVPDFQVPPGQIIIASCDGLGELTLGATWPMGVPSGFVIYLQTWIADPGAPHGFAASNAIQGTAP